MVLSGGDLCCVSGGGGGSVDRHSCYMVRADDLLSEVSADASGKGASQGMSIGCSIDTSTGVIAFTCEGKETNIRFKVRVERPTSG